MGMMDPSKLTKIPEEEEEKQPYVDKKFGEEISDFAQSEIQP